MSKQEEESLPAGWVWATVEDIADVGTGTTPLRSNSNFWSNGSIPWVTSTAVNAPFVTEGNELVTQRALDETTLRLYPKNTLIIALYGEGKTRGKVSELMIESTVNQALGTLVFSESGEQLRQFVKAFLLSRYENLRRKAAGAMQPNLNLGLVKGIRVPIAPENEQRRVVERIDELTSELDAGVAALKRVQANLKRYRASVLKSAVEGKLTEEWRANHTPKETGQELLKRILEERRQKWEAEQLASYEAKGKQPPKNWKARYKEPEPVDTSELSDLPDGWCWVRLSQVATFQNGRAFPSKEYSSSGTKLLRPGNLYADGTVGWTEKNTRRMPATWEEEHPLYVVGGGELVMNLTAQSLADDFLGRVCMTDSREHCLLNQRLARISPMSPVNTKFALLLLKSPTFRRFVNDGLNTGSLIQHMFTSQLDDFVFALPPSSEQMQIVSEVEAAFSNIEAIHDTAKTGTERAERLRQSILKDAFDGRLVAQDPADEPAAELLARIKAEREATAPKPKKKTTSRSKRVPKKITERRGAIVAYTIAQANGTAQRKSETLGRTKLVKALYVAQTHEELDLHFRFQRYAAGPFDEAVYKLEGTGNKNDWFATKERTTYGVTYHAADNTDAMCEEATKFLGDRKDSLDRLLSHINKMDMRQAELFATTYAAWNDLLIDGRDVTEASIIEDFYGWDDSKKKFKKADIKKQIKWLRANDYVPTGKGERTAERAKETRLPSRRKKK